MSSIHNLPIEILLKIFRYYMETETQLDFIYNIFYVCQKWRQVCMDSSLWYTFDGTLPLSALREFCNQGILKRTEVLKFSSYHKSLSIDDLQIIYRNLPRLKSINFSNVKCLFFRKDLFNTLVYHCHDLCEIILSGKYSKYPYSIDFDSMEFFLKKRGSKLISLDLSNSYTLNLTNLFKTIASFCPNLEKLRARNMWESKGYFPIVSMQKGLKKLKVLELDISVKTKIETTESTDGFPNLETFIYECKRHSHLKRTRFKKLVIESPNLKVLDIRGCIRVSHFILRRLPAKNLERLYISDTKVYESQKFIHILEKWGHSLVLLDISKMEENCINSLFSRLISLGHLKNLEVLYVNNTAVTMTTVNLIIQHCCKLNLLDLESCPVLSSHFRRKYRGQMEIRTFLDLNIDEEPL